MKTASLISFCTVMFTSHWRFFALLTSEQWGVNVMLFRRWLRDCGHNNTISFKNILNRLIFFQWLCVSPALRAVTPVENFRPRVYNGSRDRAGNEDRIRAVVVPGPFTTRAKPLRRTVIISEWYPSAISNLEPKQTMSLIDYRFLIAYLTVVNANDVHTVCRVSVTRARCTTLRQACIQEKSLGVQPPPTKKT